VSTKLCLFIFIWSRDRRVASLLINAVLIKFVDKSCADSTKLCLFIFIWSRDRRVASLLINAVLIKFVDKSCADF